MSTEDRKVYEQGQYGRAIGLVEADNPYAGFSRISRLGYIWLGGWWSECPPEGQWG